MREAVDTGRWGDGGGIGRRAKLVLTASAVRAVLSNAGLQATLLRQQLLPQMRSDSTPSGGGGGGGLEQGWDREAGGLPPAVAAAVADFPGAAAFDAPLWAPTVLPEGRPRWATPWAQTEVRRPQLLSGVN